MSELTGPARLTVENLGVTFGGVRAVDDVSFTAEPGAIVGLIGANGSGKTTTLDVVSGLVGAPAGHRAARRDGSGRVPARGAPARRDGPFVPGLPALPELSVLDVLLALRGRQARGGRPLHHLAAALGAAVREEEAGCRGPGDRRVGLERFRHHRTAELSTGTRRVVDLASIFLASPRLLLLDEPTAGIAQREAEAFIPLLRRLHQIADTTIVLVEHDVPLVFELCSRVVVMELGRVVADGPSDVVRADPQGPGGVSWRQRRGTPGVRTDRGAPRREAGRWTGGTG